MAVIGECSVSLYWGTLYDNINVPLHSEQIIADATKTMDLTAYIVWQTTWLTQIRINIEDYQEIVGVQYVRLVDKGTQSQGAHWYDVLDYQQVSQGCVELGLRYDTLLTIPLSTWKTCSGILRRWSVDSDGPYKYLNSPEPIDLVEPLSIGWQIIQPVARLSNSHICGFPYDMTKLPEVVTYTNPDGTATNVYYPKLSPPDEKRTSFISGIDHDTANPSFYSDGMQYSFWGQGSAAYNTYNAAISLGIDIVVNGYIVPSSWIEATRDPTTGYITQLSGTRQNYNGTLPLYIASVNNAKAGAINTTFTLASATSGDSVVVNNFQLSDGTVTIYSDPYSTGGFRARFLHYLGELIGTAGWVKSPSWQPLTVTSGVGFGTASNAISHTMSADTLNLGTAQRHDTEALTRSQMSDRYWFDVGTNTATTAINTVSAAASGNFAGAISNTANGIVSALETDLNYNQQYARLSQLSQQEDAKASHQLEMLNYAGNAGRLAPPNVKYAMARDITSFTYAFTVMAARPSANDIKRLDNFFTAFGYNVDGLLLTNPNQLRTRDRFTFVQADEVRVNSTIYSANNERIGDSQTIADIQRRFSAGIRIWRNTPNFDYSIANPIGDGT